MATTTKVIPAEFDAVVKDAIASGRYRSEEEIITDALRLWHEREQKLKKLRQEVQLGIDQLERGEWTEGEEAIRQIKERIAAGLGDLEQGKRFPAKDVFREIREDAAQRRNAES